MKRARGTGGPYLRGSVWWLKYSVGGRMIRLSTGLRGGTKDKPPKAVVEAWAEKLGQLGKGYLAGLEPQKLTFDAIAENMVNRYTAEGRTVALASLKARIKHLARAFSGWRVDIITEEAMLSYAVKRRATASVATINLELAYLRRMFSLMRKRIPNPPKVPHLPGARHRHGTIPLQHFREIVANLRWDYRALAWFLRLSGWRRGEGIGLEWRRVDWESGAIRLDTSKNGKPRFLAFGSYRRLGALLRLQRMRTKGLGCPWVFPRHDGAHIDFRRFVCAWISARKRAGHSYLIHDLRRTRVAMMDRAGVPANIGMSSVGMSPATYNRYGSVSLASQSEWMGRAEEKS